MNHRSGAETLPMAGLSAAEGSDHSDGSIRAWRFAGFEYDLWRGELYGPGGTAVVLRPKAEMLLRRFLAQPGRLFSREELTTALWPSAVVTDDSLVQCVGELRAALDDRTQRLIRTLPRRGYRWEVPVEPVMAVPSRNGSAPVASVPAAVAAVGDGEARSAPAKAPAGWALSRKFRLPLAAAGIAVALVGIAALHSRPAPLRIDEQIAARNTVAVMPFVVSTHEPELRDAADAVADQIATHLSMRLGMRGIGRASTSAADGSPLPLSQIASTLKASHVLTGRAGRAADGQRVVIDVQIDSVPKGDVVWAKRFEAAVADRLTLARDIGLQTANAMRSRPGPFDRGHAPLPDAKLDAVELTLLGWRELDRRKSLDDVLRARTRFEAALREEPNSQIALNGLASSYFIQRVDPMSGLTAEQVVQHERVVERIRKLAPEDSTGLMLWGSLQLMRGRPDLALPAFERASQLVPSYSNGYVLISRALLLSGRTAEVQAVADRAVELGAGEPRRVSDAHLVAAEAALMLGDEARAYELAGRSIVAFPTNARAYATLAAIDALAGRREQAATELAKFLESWPTATVARYDELHPSTDPAFLRQRERLYKGLRMAGLQER